jgi:hypothetical protein
MTGQQRHVTAAITKWGSVDGQDNDAIEKAFAKPARAYVPVDGVHCSNALRAAAPRLSRV